MTIVNPYLNFDGNCEEAFKFYRSVFGGDFAMVMRFKDVPAEYQMSASESEKIMHIALPIGGDTMLMGSDARPACSLTPLANTLGIRHITFAVEDIEAIVAKLKKNGAELVGEIQTYENTYKLCYICGPEGIILELAEPIEK